MPRHSIRRFVLEVLFLAGVAAAVTVADVRPAGVIVLMALAWVVVALLEWTAWLDQPHYGRGLPPRYYVPNTALPPPQPIVQRGAPFPVPRARRPAPGTDDAPTFVAGAAEWSAELGAWPLLDAPGEDTVVALPGDGDEVRVVPLPPPLAAPARSRFRLRRGREEHAVQVPDGPPPDRRIPERTLEQARAARR